jgi:hypothetical protein
MRAKMSVQSVVVNPDWQDASKTGSEVLTMAPVCKDSGYPADGSDEDNSYARWSPAGSLSLTIANPNLFGKFKIGDKFYLDFTPAS